MIFINTDNIKNFFKLPDFLVNNVINVLYFSMTIMFYDGKLLFVKWTIQNICTESQ